MNRLIQLLGNTVFLVAFFFYLCCYHQLRGQGCSDAGFCTMGALKPDQAYDKKISIKLRSLEISHYTGVTRFKDYIYNYLVDLGIGINERNSLQIKLPYVNVDGLLQDTHGIGDISIGYARSLGSVKDYLVSLTLGTKIPLGRTDHTTERTLNDTTYQLPLPMYYQPGLGTFDFIAGVSVISRNWLFAVGVQHAFGSTDNDFVWGAWNKVDSEVFREVIIPYPKGRSLRRGTDVMLRVERNFRFSNFNFNLGLLPIYRLNYDKVELPNGTVETLDGTIEFQGQKVNQTSRGLALTLLIGGGYQFSARTGIKVMNGFRLVQRDSNPDGLSRELVSNIGFQYRF